MNKQAKQRVHRNWMTSKMHSLFNAIGLSYHDFGTTKNVGYWFKFDKLTDAQKQAILDSHPDNSLIEFLISSPQYAPEIKKGILLLKY